MSRTNRKRTDNSSYSNPKSKARSRKEHSKKIENKQYRTSSNQINKKSENKNNKNIKEKTSSIHRKVCRKFPEVNTIIATDRFNKLYIEIPVVMKWYRRLSKKSIQLIVNFFILNPWALEIFRQKYSEYFVEKYKHTDENIKHMLNRIIKHNFNHGKFFNIGNLKDSSMRDIFFYKKILYNGKKELTFAMNLADLYDSYAAYHKQENGKIPYSIKIDHLIFRNTDFKKEKNIGCYGDNIRFIFANVDNNNCIFKPIPYNLGVKYILYINNKNKRKAMDKNYGYVEHQFNKAVIKEIPLISTPISAKRK